jgi:exodeoxyribonuclease VII small subunit
MGKGITLKDFLEEDIEKRLPDLSFEQGLKLLEELVASVESGSLPLDKAVLSYEKGVGLVNHLRGLLAGAEQKLKVLKS